MAAFPGVVCMAAALDPALRLRDAVAVGPTNARVHEPDGRAAVHPHDFLAWINNWTKMEHDERTSNETSAWVSERVSEWVGESEVG